MSGGMARRRGPHEAIQHPLSARALYTALYTVKPTLYRLYFGISLSRLACVVYSVHSYTAYTQYSVYSIQRYTPSLCMAHGRFFAQPIVGNMLGNGEEMEASSHGKHIPVGPQVSGRSRSCGRPRHSNIQSLNEFSIENCNRQTRAC